MLEGFSYGPPEPYGKEIGSGQKVGVRRKRVAKADVDDDVLEAASGEFRLDAVAHGGTLVGIAQKFGPIDGELEVVVQIDRLCRDQVGCGGLHAVSTGEIEIVGGAGPVAQTEIERNPALDDPTIRGGDEQPSQQSLEDDELAQAPKRWRIAIGRNPLETLLQGRAERLGAEVSHEPIGWMAFATRAPTRLLRPQAPAISWARVTSPRAIACLMAASTCSGGGAGLGRVQDRARRRGESDALADDDVRRFNWPSGGMDDDARKVREVPLRPGHHQVDGVGNDVGEVEQIERAFVRYHGNIPPEGEPGGGDILIWRARIVAEPIEAASDAAEPSGASMAGQQRLRVPAGVRLFAGEVAVLPGCRGKQARLVGLSLHRVTHRSKNT